MDKIKLLMYENLQKYAFITVLLCASVMKLIIIFIIFNI